MCQKHWDFPTCPHTFLLHSATEDLGATRKQFKSFSPHIKDSTMSGGNWDRKGSGMASYLSSLPQKRMKPAQDLITTSKQERNQHKIWPPSSAHIVMDRKPATCFNLFQVWDNPTVMQGINPMILGWLSVINAGWREHIFHQTFSSNWHQFFWVFFLAQNRISRTSQAQVSLWQRKPAHYTMKHSTHSPEVTPIFQETNFKAKHEWRDSLWIVFWNSNRTSAQFGYVFISPCDLPWLTFATYCD